MAELVPDRRSTVIDGDLATVLLYQHGVICEAHDYAFSKGEWVFVLLLATQRDPAWGPDAEEFNPDRFAPDANRGRAPELFKPFGTGIRSCIGRQFALHEMALALATLVQRFDIEPEPDYELAVEETLTLRPKNLRLKFSRV